MAKLNGKGPYRFIVDTGCSYAAIIDKGLMKTLKLLPKQTASGGSNFEDAEPVKLKSITIGGAKFSNVGALPDDIRGFMPSDPDAPIGILGIPLFKNCLLTFDYPNQKFTFELGRLPQNGNDILRCSFDEQHGSILTIKLTVAGIKMDVHIDTGSPGVLTLLNKWQEKLPLKEKPVKIGQANTPSGSTDIYTTTLNGTLQVGNYQFKNPKVDFADLGPMLDSDCGNIGSGLLKDFALTVDQKNHRLRLRRGSNKSEPPRRQIVRKKNSASYRIGVAFRPNSTGWIVENVLAGGAGEESNLKQGDVVISVNGTQIGKMTEKMLDRTFGSPEPITLKVHRGEKTLTITLTPKRVED